MEPEQEVIVEIVANWIRYYTGPEATPFTSVR